MFNACKTFAPVLLLVTTPVLRDNLFFNSKKRNECSASESVPSATSRKSQILFLGTGSSLGTPVASHLMNPNHSDPRTRISRVAAEGDPRHNKNYRCNPSILIRHRVNGKKERNFIVDVGKTFREASVRWFPVNDIQHIDAILLTHGHADAIFGLDDVRNIQLPADPQPMPVFLSQQCLAAVKKVFFYLFPSNSVDGEVPRLVSSVSWQILSPLQPLHIHDLHILPFNVMHGEDMTSLGFIFSGNGGAKVCYISDISRMLPESLAAIKAAGPIDLLVIDALAVNYQHPTHYSVEQSVALCRVLNPTRALLVGMGSQIEHFSTNEDLRRLMSEGLDIQLAYDGMTLDVDL